MGIFSKKESNMINETYVETSYSTKLFGKKKIKSVLINEDLYEVVDSKIYETESRFDANQATLLKCGSKFILLNDIDMSNISFGNKIRELNHYRAIEYLLESMHKYDNIVLFLEEVEKEDLTKELRYVIFKFKEKNIAHLETVELVRNMIDNTLGKNELPDFPYIEIINGIVSRLLRFAK